MCFSFDPVSFPPPLSLSLITLTLSLFLSSYSYVSRQEETQRRGGGWVSKESNQQRAWIKELDGFGHKKGFLWGCSVRNAVVRDCTTGKDVGGRWPLLRAMLHSGNANPPIAHSHAQTCTSVLNLFQLCPTKQTCKPFHNNRESTYLTPLKRFPASCSSPLAWMSGWMSWWIVHTLTLASTPSHWTQPIWPHQSNPESKCLPNSRSPPSAPLFCSVALLLSGTQDLVTAWKVLLALSEQIRFSSSMRRSHRSFLLLAFLSFWECCPPLQTRRNFY